MNINIKCIDTSKPLYGFWKYDVPPFILGGEIEKITDNDKIAVKGYTGCLFTPILITTIEDGKRIQRVINDALSTYNESVKNAKELMTTTINMAMSFNK